MEYKSEMSQKESGEMRKQTSRLVIEENTIYEIDLDCENRKNCRECGSYNYKSRKGV